MSVVSDITFDDVISTESSSRPSETSSEKRDNEEGGPPSVVSSAKNDNEEGVEAVDHYDPRDLIVSWMKQQPSQSMDEECGITTEDTPTRRSRRAQRTILAVALVLLVAALSILVATLTSGSSDGEGSSRPPPPNTIFPGPPPLTSTLAPTPHPPVSTPSPTTRATPTIAPTTRTTVAPTAEPTIPLTVDGLLDFLRAVSFDSGLALSDETTPQFNAFSWLASDPSFSQYSTEQVIQRYALATFYFGTSGDGWVNNTGWLNSDHECTWELGVSRYFVEPCTPNGEVKGIGLTGNELRGALPPELGLLSNSLQVLDLKLNHVSGKIPTEMTLLSTLALLNLRNNNVTGTIPTQISNMKGLVRLSLQSNKITGNLPIDIGSVLSLRDLRLGDNNLDGTISPDMIANLTNLELLALNNNSLTGFLPTEFGLLTTLQRMILCHNSMSGFIPTELGQMTSLVSMDLDNNNLEGSVPEEVCGLAGTTDIDVDCDEVLCSCCGSTCLKSLLSSLSLDAGAALADPTSPQSSAFTWLTSTPQPSYNFPRVLQRYVLAVLYYSTSGPGWTLLGGYLDMNPQAHVQNECSEIASSTTLATRTNLQLPLQVVSATASSRQSLQFSASAAVDGDTSTYWASTASDDPQWLYAKFSQIYVLDSISLVWGDGAHAVTYRIETSHSARDWTVAQSRIFGRGGTETLRFPQQTVGQYLRIYATAGAADRYVVSEMTVWGSPPPAVACNDDSNNIVKIYLAHNHLQGTIPPELALLSDSLQVLHLRDNNLTGHVPTELSLLSLLRELDVSSNNLTGSLPEEMCELSFLTEKIELDCEELACACCPQCP